MWNILTGAIWWWLPISVTAITADDLGTGDMAVGIKPVGGFRQKNRPSAGTVALFNASEPQPKQVGTGS